MARRLLRLRLALEPNASAFAETVGLTPQDWYNYESGRRGLSPDVAALLVERCGVDYNWIYGGVTDRLSAELRLLLNP